MHLKVKNLCFSYYKKPLCLKDVSFELNRGDKVLLLATKDSGKSTFLKVVSGFEKSYFGSILLNGTELKYVDDKSKKVSLLLSEPVVLKHKSIRQNIDYLCEVEGLDKLSDEELNTKLFEFKINKNPKDKIKTLSLFEKRKFCLMRCFIKNSDIIFLDDQFEGLNHAEVLELTQIYDKFLCDNSKTVICAIGEDSYLKTNSFFENKHFKNVLFLSFANCYCYKNITKCLSDAKTLDFVKFKKNIKLINADLILKNEEFFVDCDELFVKIDKKQYSKLLNLNLEDGEKEKIVLVCDESLKVFDLSDQKFNKMIEDNEIFVYQDLDQNRMI